MTFKNINFSFLKRILLIFDLVLFPLSMHLAYWFRFESLPKFGEVLSPMALLVFIFISILYLFGCYNYTIRRFNLKYVAGLTLSIVVSLGIVFTYVFVMRLPSEGIFGRGVLLGGIGIFYGFCLLHRGALLYWASQQIKKQRWLVILSDSYRDHFLNDLDDFNPSESYFFIVSENESTSKIEALGKRCLGKFSELSNVIGKGEWSGIIVGLNDIDMQAMSASLMDLRFRGIQIIGLTEFYETKWQKVPVYFLSRSWFVLSKGFSLVGNQIGLRVKRFYDILGALTLFILTLPLMILTYLIVKLESRGPGIFKQKRVGQNNKVFTIYKFRSMKNDAEKDGVKWAEKNDARVTLIGKIIRKTRIDELPQLVNVLKGDMSFIGPRPERPEFTAKLEEQIPHYKLRHLLKPGITGWAQVEYRYASTLEDTKEKLQYDLFYIKGYSLFLDGLIIVKTIKIVLGWRGR